MKLKAILFILLVPLLIGIATLVSLAGNGTPPTQDIAYAQDDPLVVTVEVPVTVEVTRVVTVVVTPTHTPVPPTATPVPPEILVDDDAYIGNPDAPIKIVEFSDFQCGFCARFAAETLTPLTERYGDLIQYVYRDFPIFGDPSILAALGSECAAEQDPDEFWTFHDRLFANHISEERVAISYEFLLGIVQERELDEELWLSCVEGETAFQEIVDDYRVGAGQGITGTPAFFVNETFISGAQPLEVFIQIIDEQLVAMGIEPPAAPDLE